MKTSPFRRRLRIRFAISLIVIGSTIPASDTICAEDEHGLRDTGLVCAVDMGSNTFKFIVAEIKNGKYVQLIDDRKTVGVGDDLKASEKKSGHKVISESKLNEMKLLLAEFQDKCEQETKSRKIHAIATAAFREAENSKIVFQQLHEQGIDMHILTGEEESVYAYEAATLGEAGFAVIDLGSRTTEFVTKIGPKYQWVEIATGYKVAWDDFYENGETFSQASAQHVNQLKELVGENEMETLHHQRELMTIEVGETSS